MSTSGKKKTLTLALVVLGVVAAGVAYRYHAATSAGGAAPAILPDIPVSAAPVDRRDMPVTLEGLGNVQSSQSVTVRTQVDGQLKQVLFHEGQEVKAGDPLAQIDPRSFQAALDQAIAKKASDQAQLANARRDADRYKALLKEDFVSRQQMDTTLAQVAQLEAAVKGDEAAIESARVNLSYTNIASPISGRAGIRQIDAGNIVHAGDAAGLVVVSQMKPISVLFTLPEDSVPRIVKSIGAGAVPVAVFSRDGKMKLGDGHLELLDNQIDQGTGMVRLKAEFPNDEGLLWPGQFVIARLLQEVHPQALTMPVTALLHGQQGAFVWVVNKADGTVESRMVDAGQIEEGRAEILKGLDEGDMVVTAGQYRLQKGTKVVIGQTPAE